MNRLLRIDEFEHLMNCVSEERRAKIKKFINPADAHRGLIGEVLIRSIICKQFQISNDQIFFITQQYGKPCVTGIPSFHFNVSHSGRWIVCAVDCHPVGIDVEEIKPIDLEIAKHYFSMEEYLYLMEQPEHRRVSCFYELWTIKESFVKLVGKGLALPPRSFSVNPEAMHHHSVRLADSYVSCFFKRLNVGPHYKMAICSTRGDFPAQMIVKRYDELRKAIE
ncbi:MAG: holo-[acyl-carrier-protein] synthase [Bacilli bacterium]|nr:holo-[acyl-carrier-protein] synthase [Bacilli bacterium]